MSTNMRQQEVGVQTIKNTAKGRWVEILVELGGVSPEHLNERHHPCPKCGGKDRFRFLDPETGAVICNQCFNEKNGDGIAALMWLNGWSFTETLGKLAEWLGLTSPPPPKSSGGYKVVAEYEYKDEQNTVLYKKIRCEAKGLPKKIHYDGEAKGKHTLYRLPDLLDSGSAQVFIVEGEKDADRLADLGLTVTTSGSNTSWKDDFKKHFKSRHVFILPDNDEPGREYAENVAKSLHGVAKSIKVVELPDLPEKGDVSDWLDAGHTIGELKAIVDQAEEWSPDDSLRYKPFPLHALPPTIRRYVEEVATAMGCDPGFIAPHVLTVLASAVGNGAILKINGTWSVHASLWAAVVAESGTMKSPGFHAAVDLLRPIEKRFYDAFSVEQKRYATEETIHHADLAAWKRSGRKNNEPPPESPEPPILERLTVNDTTTEALLPILAENPSGLLVANDELSGWLSSMDVYKQGQGKDAATWLGIYNGKPVSVDRKRGREHIRVEMPIVSISGTCQPGVLRRILLGRDGEYVENGLAARFLFANPPTKSKVWTEETVSESTRHAALSVVETLVEFRRSSTVPDVWDASDGNLCGFDTTPSQTAKEPKVLELHGEAKAAWIRFYNEHAKETESSTGPIRAVWSKLEATAARLALVLHMTRCAEAGEIFPIDRQSIEAGVTLARWFGHEARRLYADISIGASTEVETEQRDLIELIKEQGGKVTPRDLAHKKRRYRAKGESVRALDSLVSNGYGAWDGEAGKKYQKGSCFILNSE